MRIVFIEIFNQMTNQALEAVKYMKILTPIFFSVQMKQIIQTVSKFIQPGKKSPLKCLKRNKIKVAEQVV